MLLTGNKKLSLSESFNDLQYVKQSKGGLAWDVVSPPRQLSPNRSPDAVNPCDKSNLEVVILILYFNIMYLCFVMHNCLNYFRANTEVVIGVQWILQTSN